MPEKQLAHRAVLCYTKINCNIKQKNFEGLIVMKKHLLLRGIAVLAAIALLVGVFALPAAAAIPAGAAKEVVRLVNEERAKEGLPALKNNYGALTRAAQKRATELPQRFDSTHARPDGSAWHTVLKDYNVRYTFAGENIAYGHKSAAQVVQAWMDSPGHRKNILGKFTHIGVGIHEENGRLNWSQEFANVPAITLGDIFISILRVITYPLQLLFRLFS